MQFTAEDLTQIGEYVQSHLMEWLPEHDVDLNARIMRIDERLDEQQKTIQQGFGFMEKLFDQADTRFERIEKHLEKIDKRLNQVDARLDQIDTRLEYIDKRFELVDKRFDDLRSDMSARFTDMSRQTTRWMTGLMMILGMIGIAVTVTNFLP